MSKDYLYPDISVQVFNQIEVMRRLHRDNPDYFTAAECPYSETVGRLFRGWFDTPLGAASWEGSEYSPLLSETKWDALYREVVGLFESLKSAKPAGGDSSESMAYFRTATGLLDKLVSHQERCLGIKEIHEFHSTIMEVMENELTEEQRERVMKRLKDSIKQG